MTNPLHIFRAWQQRRREKRMQKEREETRKWAAAIRDVAIYAQAFGMAAELSSRILDIQANREDNYIDRVVLPGDIIMLREQLNRAIQSENYELAAVLRDRINKSKEA